MGDSLTAALTASGVVYELGDFSDPHLDGPTALQVDDDGNVRGHLACWDTPHIGYADVVTPPRTASGYQFFHQGVVRTAAGDLPVGKLTIGTGHAGPNGDHLAAAAHYDNTGSTVAVVRAGEDAHGIWLAGKIVPGTADVRIDELRRSSVSGDWRDIRHNGQFELVAALACNVPGFPIPRTETLVASGRPVGLVAAGVVHRPDDVVLYSEVERMVASAVRVNTARRERRDEIRARFAGEHAAVQSARQDRVRAVTAAAAPVVSEARLAGARTRMAALLAAGVPKTDDQKAKPLERYWTQGKGLARWATTATPYRSLVAALRTEIEPGEMTDDQLKGLAANYYHKVFHKWPGKRGGGKLTAAADPAERRKRFAKIIAGDDAEEEPGDDPAPDDEASDKPAKPFPPKVTPKKKTLVKAGGSGK